MALALISELRRLVIIGMCASIVIAAAAVAIDLLHHSHG